jgi:hypothetical protein
MKNKYKIKQLDNQCFAITILVDMFLKETIPSELGWFMGDLLDYKYCGYCTRLTSDCEDDSEYYKKCILEWGSDQLHIYWIPEESDCIYVKFITSEDYKISFRSLILYAIEDMIKKYLDEKLVNYQISE